MKVREKIPLEIGEVATEVTVSASAAQSLVNTVSGEISTVVSQRQVLELLSRGLTNPEIGDALGIRLGTVKVHVARIFEVLDVTNRAEAVRVFTEAEAGSGDESD